MAAVGMIGSTRCVDFGVDRADAPGLEMFLGRSKVISPPNRSRCG